MMQAVGRRLVCFGHWRLVALLVVVAVLVISLTGCFGLPCGDGQTQIDPPS